jgi:hypothetical protein
MPYTHYPAPQTYMDYAARLLASCLVSGQGTGHAGGAPSNQAAVCLAADLTEMLGRLLAMATTDCLCRGEPIQAAAQVCHTPVQVTVHCLCRGGQMQVTVYCICRGERAFGSGLGRGFGLRVGLQSAAAHVSVPLRCWLYGHRIPEKTAN